MIDFQKHWFTHLWMLTYQHPTPEPQTPEPWEPRPGSPQFRGLGFGTIFMDMPKGDSNIFDICLFHLTCCLHLTYCPESWVPSSRHPALGTRGSGVRGQSNYYGYTGQYLWMYDNFIQTSLNNVFSSPILSPESRTPRSEPQQSTISGFGVRHVVNIWHLYFCECCASGVYAFLFWDSVTCFVTNRIWCTPGFMCVVFQLQYSILGGCHTWPIHVFMLTGLDFSGPW
jgi:hypothetical protein